ncbi:MAG: hypothetical protein MUD15_01055 [Desulfobacterota bacterium]|jgi:glucose-6-phosphate isomerase|nr:hypothetical protein [Thermodesulfobacteriota bacterium]
MPKMEMSLGPYRSAVEKRLREIVDANVVDRIGDMDHTVWKNDPGEITDRLGWLGSPSKMRGRVQEMNAFADEMRSAGYTRALLLGMGGSSLAPDVMGNTFGARSGFLDLAVLDSTDPSAVRALTGNLDLATTLFIVSTKSGTTVETLSFFKYCYNLTVDSLGSDQAGSHFIAITDPGNPLEGLSRRCSFRRIFAGEPTIGGRFSALSVFGLVPASLMGLDLARLLERSISMADACRCADGSLDGPNDAVKLGAALGVLSLAGRDKLTFFLSPAIAGFGGWVEQLVAESTGKEHKGILPVIGEAASGAGMYGADRVFVSMGLRGDETPMPDLERIRAAGHPVIHIFLDDIYDIGGQFFLWEFATAVAGHVLSINPFDQPDVEATKKYSRAAVQEYLRSGRLETTSPILDDHGVAVYGDLKAATLRDALISFLAKARGDSYVSFQAYLPCFPAIQEALNPLRLLVRDRYRVATTLGFGPRFLHSTGQLHKGDAGRGLFIQITCEDPADLDIPDEPGSAASSMSFGVLKAAQAVGDAAALRAAGRPVMKLHIGGPDMAAAIQRITANLK